MGSTTLTLSQRSLTLWILIQYIVVVILALPTIKQQPQRSVNYVQQLDKTFFQPPEVEQTIDEVQKILANDPALPRLTRGEIEELYEKVTREEYEKSVEAGDMSRADSMRALMLVLPFNTDNNTEENLQELYTRQPVTRVIDAYTPPEPIKFLTPDPSAAPRSTVPGGNPAVAATTYKPSYNFKQHQHQSVEPTATTYHPSPSSSSSQQQQKLQQQQLQLQQIQQPMLVLSKPTTMEFQPLLPNYDYQKSVASAPPSAPQRFSSHYSAKNAEFLRKPRPSVENTNISNLSTSTSTVKPVADILESLGIVGKRGTTTTTIDDYYPAESAPQPVIASVADLRGLQGARIKPDAYSNFKPLNIGEELRVKPEVEGYLTRFGIVKKSSKSLHKAAASQLSPKTAQLTQSPPPQSNAELAKLLENLQELERLQGATKVATKVATTAATIPTTRATTTTTTTSTTTTRKPLTTTTSQPPTALPTAQLITHGAPLLIEPKKPRRRIDPNIDINFANGGNQQTPQHATDELTKLLENLQELEKLKINPNNAMSLGNRFTTVTPPTTTTTTTRSSNNDAQQLQVILKQLQQFEQANAAQKTARNKLTTTTTTTTTSKPILSVNNDLAQLQRLLNDDQELERLYEQARKSQKSATTTTTTTTVRPSVDLSELQAYFAAIDRITSTTTTKPPPTTTTTTTSTTTTRRPPPPPPPPPTKLPNVDHAQFEQLITRVQQLERLNETPGGLQGFSTRNIHSLPTSTSSASTIYNSLPSNDFAQLQQLAAAAAAAQSQLQLQSQSYPIEISTARTSRRPSTTLTSFELSNDTGNADVTPQDYVQLQKLLSKVQELERIQIQPTSTPHLVTAASVRTQNVKSLNGAHIVYAQPANKKKSTQHSNQQHHHQHQQQYHQSEDVGNIEITSSEELRELAMSQPANPANPQRNHNHNADDNDNDNDDKLYQQFFSSLEDDGERQSYLNMQPIYKTITTSKATSTTTTSKPTSTTTTSKPTSSVSSSMDLAELQKLLYNAEQLKQLGVTLPTELSKQLESKLQGDSTTTTTTTTTSSPLLPVTASSGSSSSDSSSPAVFSLTTVRPNAHARQSQPNPSPSTESSVELPVFSATKIIEAAIKRAANRIGVSTEQPSNKNNNNHNNNQPIMMNSGLGSGFRRRSDTIDIDEHQQDEDILDEGVLNGDLMAEFSEINYQLALPPMNISSSATATPSTKTTPPPPRSLQPEPQIALDELQRLISNLQELQKLNVSLDNPHNSQFQSQSLSQSQADAQYLQSLQTDDELTEAMIKARRQSDTPTTTTTAATTMQENLVSTTQAPTKISLGLGVMGNDNNNGGGDDDDITETPSSSSSTTTTTEESRNGSLDDLADSFGPDPVSQEPPPAKKKNGFYFLADWNSFLEVGDGDDQVVVRLSPKIGDPRLFLPVKIP